MHLDLQQLMQKDSVLKYLGIDPGLISGAWACIDHNGEFVACGDIPNANGRVQPRLLKIALQDAIAKDPDGCEIIIEQVGVRPGQGMASSAAFMRATGCIEAVASLLLYPVHFVTPQCWKKHYGLIKTPKAASLSLARSTWPSAGLKLAKHHGRAEALLMAAWGRGEFA